MKSSIRLSCAMTQPASFNGKAALFAGLLALVSTTVPAQSEETPSPLTQGFYVAPLLGYTKADSGRLADDGLGGTLALGLRREKLALEAYYQLLRLDSKLDGGPRQHLDAYGFSGLLFPWESLGFYGLAGGGLADNKGLAQSEGSHGNWFLDIGLGYLQSFGFERYDLGVRVDARYRVSQRDGTGGFEDGPSDLEDLVFQVGLQLPLGGKKPAAVDAAATAVVPVASICADGQDNDGDGRIDFPADTGCSSTDDGDETDPPVCADGQDNDDDGLIDFPADKGCAAAEDNDEKEPCKMAEAGEKLSLGGCGSGDVIILRGVNFEFDHSRLTPDAQKILDDVASELTRYPDIWVELGGHTDARGADDYNQRLSEQRARSVVAYLESKGIDVQRLTAVGYGESTPVADNDSEAGRELNRRVELKLLEANRQGPASAQGSDPASQP